MEFTVHYHEVNLHGEATPLTMLYFMEDAAIAHSEAAGFGIGRLKNEGLAWVLNRWHFEMDRYPSLGESVTIETWPSNFDRFYATREFLIKNSQHEILGRATSRWIFLNLEKKRPLRIKDAFAEAYGLDSHRAIESDFEELDSVEYADREHAFLVRRSDIDTNGHVNNVKYL